MIRRTWNDGWSVGGKLGAFERPDGATMPVPVRLPHDALRDLPRDPASPQGVHAAYFPDGAFTYTKTFAVPEEWRDRSVSVEFEGVYRDAVVSVNGDFAAHHAGGYSAFTVPLDGLLRFGERNRIAVDARVHKDSRWYTGAGIIRPVHLVVAAPVHLALDGVLVRTCEVDEVAAVVEVSTEVVNTTRHTRRTRVVWQATGPDGGTAASATSPVTVPPGETVTARARLLLDRPRLWDPEDPALHALRTELHDDGTGGLLDADETRFGVRTLQLDPARGLRVNGRTVLLRGACVHHDNGPLGGISLDAAEDRRVRLLKAAGFNALRSAHNPMSRAMLDACDRHGVLVMDELTDVWARAKTSFDASLAFPTTWRAEVRAMVRKDRNHPSVVMYSIGNEILELASPLGSTWSRRIAEAVREDDPTRWVTNGINGVVANLDALGELAPSDGDPNAMMAAMGETMAAVNASDLVTDSTEESAAVLDVVGLNYADSRYAPDAERFPNRVIVGSETFPDRIGALWPQVLAHPHVIGDFTWTGWDYLGEAGIGRVDYSDAPGYAHTGTSGPYPHLLAGTGDLDITGFRRPASYYREIVFGLRTDPYIAVHRPQHFGRPVAGTPWSWSDSVAAWGFDVPDGSPVVVDVYADADEVELLRDGRTVGRSAVGEVFPAHARFETVTDRGTLAAIARRDGVEVGRCVLAAPAGPLRLAVRAERERVAGVDDLAYVVIGIEDADGVVAVDADASVRVRIDGPGTLAALGTGRIATEEGFAGPAVVTFDGRALAIVRPTGPGTIEVVVESDGFDEASARVVVAEVDTR